MLGNNGTDMLNQLKYLQKNRHSLTFNNQFKEKFLSNLSNKLFFPSTLECADWKVKEEGE